MSTEASLLSPALRLGDGCVPTHRNANAPQIWLLILKKVCEKRSAGAPVDHAHGLALAARDLAARQQLDRNGDADALAQRVRDAGAQVGAVDPVGGGLAVDRELVQRAGALDDELVVGRDAGNAEERVLDLGGIEVDA